MVPTQRLGAGDVDQLPPVGAGKVLTDAIQSGVIPGVDLREIFRQAQQSGIVRTAHAVNGGNFQAVHQGLPTIDPTHVKARFCVSPLYGGSLCDTSICAKSMSGIPVKSASMHIIEPCMALQLAAATITCQCLATVRRFVLTVLLSPLCCQAASKAYTCGQVGKLKLQL